ncbi:unnamed protein product [Meganyctiphanes norvegica]|uniref:Tetraspanin n=1 Tax=Meganyctiphanes norvegica TaxID=48144 RepID=A0AAV2PME5_MEGNR
MGCLDCLSKSLLFVLNTLVFLIGVGVTAISVVGIVGIDTLLDEIKDELNLDELGDGVGNTMEDIIEEVKELTDTSLYVVLGVGIFILVIGFLGCCGACKKSSCMLKTYASVILVLVIVQITLGALAVVWSDTVEEQIKTDLWKQFDKYNPMDLNTRNETDLMQQTLKCCGVESYQDWMDATYLKPTASIPDGCCVDYELNCGANYFTTTQQRPIYTEGCYQMAKNDILFYIDLVGGIVIGVIVVEVLCVVGAFYLSCKKKK